MISKFRKQQPVDSTPHYRARAFLDPVEAAVYNALIGVFDAKTKVLAKVALAELVAAPKTDRQYLQHWRRVQRRTIDFLICSAPALQPILAIKLVTESDSKKRRVSGPGILEEVLGDIGLPLLRLKAQDEYDAKDLAEKINFTLKESRKPRPTDPHQPQQSETLTTGVTRKLTDATRSAVDLWTSTKSKYRTRTSPVSK